MNHRPHIVVLGAGYGGLVTARYLQKLIDPNAARVTLINKHAYHYLTTLLHKPAAGTSTVEEVQVSIPDLLDETKVNFIKSTVQAIQPAEKKIMLHEQTLQYDYLVIGLGGEPETFNVPGLERYAMTISSLNKADAIRRHIEERFAQYKQEPDRKELLTIVVGGAGFTGTEFVGELADNLAALCTKYGIDPSLPVIYNVERSPQPLPPGFPPDLVEYGVNVLRRKGIQYKLGASIEEVTPEGVKLSGGEFLRAATVIWTGGIRGNRLLEQAGFETERGRVKVDPYLRSPQYPDVWIVGDCSVVLNAEGKPYPATAQIAIQQGVNAARNLAAVIRGGELKPFRFSYKGEVASLGKDEAVGQVFGMKIKGRAAVWMKKLIEARYLFILGGFRLMLRKSDLFK